MGAQLRVFRRRIKSVQATKKITKAMELIASSRIIKAQAAVQATEPYARELLRAVGLAASHTRGDHPLTAKARLQKRAAVLLITADRGLAGAYSVNAIREGERLAELLHAERSMEVVPFIVGRKGLAFYNFRERDVADSWTGFTDSPTYEDAKPIAKALLDRFLMKTEDGGVDEINIIYTRYFNRGRQEVRVGRILPLEVVEEVIDTSESHITGGDNAGGTPVWPLYDFEPSAEEALDALLPKYLEYLVYAALLESSASEHAARQRAMSSATDNADDLMKSLTRQANQARQAEITQEISEIVGGADALASATSGS
ncbi:MAG: F0F1 ATP synthase subunit gamma [Candidatus Nanopelagicales bacterium]